MKTDQKAILYIIMRTDLDSLNPGKMAAQACHAANWAVSLCSVRNEQLYYEWKTETIQNFGTTIVLNGGLMENIQSILDEIEVENFLIENTADKAICGVVHDPTYPISDGNTTHLIPLDTCAFVMCWSNSKAANILSYLELHP